MNASVTPHERQLNEQRMRHLRLEAESRMDGDFAEARFHQAEALRIDKEIAVCKLESHAVREDVR